MKDYKTLSSERRSVLKSAPAVSGFLLLGELATGRTAASEDASVVHLGEFSDGLDGWTTNGGNDLSRVSEEEMPAAVRAGTHALSVRIDGDRHPMIENEKKVKKANVAEHPYLLAHVFGYAEDTSSDLMFKFRLHHTATPTDGRGNGNGNSGGNGGRGSGKDVLVEESDEQTVSQINPSQIKWNLTDLDDEILETAKRLEITWYLKDQPAEGGPRGRNKGDFDYRGRLALDDIRLTDDVSGGEILASQEKTRDLHRKHGMIAERTFEKRGENMISGTFVFVDGTEVPVAVEKVDEQVRYTIDGESFFLGGDQ